ncbi:helix-turn-helix transcriptional regulator [Streptomyces sp. NPDC048491]|uniref:helix-turn-helix domain-containing protein n=1 Tax=unclassified Streptomyces TaxID=2593676 RepID=UPI00341468AC
MPSRKEPDASASVPSFYGAELRYRREAAGLTLAQLVDGSFRGIPFLSQIEHGERRMPMDLAKHVDVRLGTDGFFQRRCEDVRRARQSGHAEYFADVVAMERGAETIEEWSPILVPGLLQTPDYARAVIRAAQPRATHERVEEMVSARVSRASLFEQDECPEFWAILDESVIRRRVVPSRHMAELLEHVIDVVHATRGVLQIVPETAACHPFMMGTARVVTFPDAPAMTYMEAMYSGQVIDSPELVKKYRRSYDRLKAVALSPRTSLNMIEKAAEGHRNGRRRRRLDRRMLA